MCPKGLTPRKEEAATLSSFLQKGFYSLTIHVAMLKFLPFEFQDNLLFPNPKSFTLSSQPQNLWHDFTLSIKAPLSLSFPGEMWTVYIKMAAATLVCTDINLPLAAEDLMCLLSQERYADNSPKDPG